MDGRDTVGGTSLAAFRPGFLRGGRTQVLLNALFWTTATTGRLDTPGERCGAFTALGKLGRGASGGASIADTVDVVGTENDILR